MTDVCTYIKGVENVSIEKLVGRSENENGRFGSGILATLVPRRQNCLIGPLFVEGGVFLGGVFLGVPRMLDA